MIKLTIEIKDDVGDFMNILLYENNGKCIYDYEVGAGKAHGSMPLCPDMLSWFTQTLHECYRHRTIEVEKKLHDLEVEAAARLLNKKEKV